MGTMREHGVPVCHRACCGAALQPSCGSQPQVPGAPQGLPAPSTLVLRERRVCPWSDSQVCREVLCSVLGAWDGHPRESVWGESGGAAPSLGLRPAGVGEAEAAEPRACV